MHVTVPLEMCLYLLKEQDYVPWAMALTHLDKWKEILQETSLIPELNYFLRHVLTPMYNKLGWNDEGTHNERLMRNIILTHSVTSKMPEALDRAKKYFQELKKSQKSVPPDFRYIIFQKNKFPFRMVIRHFQNI